MPIRQSISTVTAEEARERINECAGAKKEDPKYVAEYKKYIDWLKGNNKSLGCSTLLAKAL